MKDAFPMMPKATWGQKIADFIARTVGSWRFIIIQSIALFSWVVWNTVQIVHSYHFDPYPYILLNLMLSFQAAYTGPILLIAANRQAQRDRIIAETTRTMVSTLLQLTEHLIKQSDRDAIYNKKLHELMEKVLELQKEETKDVDHPVEPSG